MVASVIRRIINLTDNYKNVIVESNNPMITSSNINADPYAVVSYGSEKAFETNGNNPDEWIQIKIKKYRISASEYRVKTFTARANFSHMKQWKLMASNNNRT